MRLELSRREPMPCSRSSSKASFFGAISRGSRLPGGIIPEESGAIGRQI